MTSGQGLDQSFFRIATECAGVLKDFCRGQRAKAKKALQRLAQEHPNSFLPHRYLARLLYHESARVEADQQGSSGTLPSHRRLSLLHSALLEAKQASELAPGSLSSAALRATLLVNLLVEESALQGGLAISQEQPPQPPEQTHQGVSNDVSGSAAGLGSGDAAWYQLQPEARCEAIKREFREAIAHCVRTLECGTPLLVEPVITISDAHARTCDPCCLRVQDNIVEWVKQDNWQRIVAEKRSVLACMHQVLESCHTLLDSTHIPVDGIVRLLQHILRPHQQDLQLWASQLLLSKGSVDDFQQKFETQAAVTELLRMLRPGRPGDEVQASSSCAQAPIQQNRTQTSPAAANMQVPVNAVAPQPPQPPPPQQQQVRAVGAQGQAAVAQAESVAQGRVAAGPLVQPAPPPPPQQELPPCLSAEQEWDDVREGVSAPSSGAGASGAGGSGARRAGAKAKNKAKANDTARGPRKERSRYERYMDVETFWRTTSPEQRHALLKVPMAALLKGVRREQGNDAVDELIEGLVLLREQGNRAACYWLCPVCEQKFHSSRDFLGHVELVHEGLAVQDNKYVCCYKCQQDVVGMYYTSTRTAGYNLCFRCYAADAASVNSPEAFEKVFMRPSAGGRTWSHSDFMSTRDSFSSLSERSHRHHHYQQAAAAQKAHQAGGAAAVTGSGGHVHSAACRHHPHCPHHSHAHGHGQAQYGLETSVGQPVLGEASDEWLAPLPAGSLSAPVTMPDPRAAQPGPATLPPPHSTGMRPRGKRSSGDSCSSSDSLLGQSLHSRSLSEPPNHGRGTGAQAGGPGGADAAPDDGADGGNSSSATWRSWWATRLMQGWSGKGQPQQSHQQGPGQQRLAGQGPSGQGRDGSGQGGSEASNGAAALAADFPPSSEGSEDSGSVSSEDDDIALRQPPHAAGGTPSRGGGAADLSGADYFAGSMNGMVAELMTRLREIYLTDRDLGDMSLGSITQFVFSTLRASAAADDLHLASCPPGPRAVLLEFLAQPSIVFQRPQALAVVLGLLPLEDLQKVALYAMGQHEEAVSGAEAAARDIAAGSDEDADVGGDDEDDGEGPGGCGSDSEQEYQLERMAARDAMAAAVAEAATASHMQMPVPRARRRLRYTSRRAPAGSSVNSQPQGSDASTASQYVTVPAHHYHQQGAGAGAQLVLPHAGMGEHGLAGIHLRRIDDEASAEEVSEEEMESAGDGLEYALGPDGEPLSLRALPPHYAASIPRSQQHQLQQLRHAGGAGMHAVAHAAVAVGDGVGAIICDGERSVGASLDDEGDEDVSEDVEGEADEEDVSDEEDGVSLGPEDEEEEEDGPCVSLFVVAGDVELGFDRLITQMWGGGADSDDPGAAQLEQQQQAAAGMQVAPAGNNRSRSQHQGNRGGRNQGRQHSPTARGGGGSSAALSAAGANTGSNGLNGCGAAEDSPLAEELVGPSDSEPYLQVADWWLDHLLIEGNGPTPDELRVLRWVFGNVINVQAEEFCARQRELRGGRERDVAILELYDEVAAVWRSLQAVTDKRSRLEALRRATRGHFAVVKRLEEAGGHATLEQATEFLDAVLSGYCQGQQGAPGPVAAVAAMTAGSAPGSAVAATGAAAPPEQPGTPTASEASAVAGEGLPAGDNAAAGGEAATAVAPGGNAAGPSGPLLYLCERAVEVVRRHPALAQEPSQRYAAALLERELSVLALVEVMVAAEAEEAARERGVAEESLKRHRAEHREAEAEYQRVQAEGPASHRKKDLLDKATKEAEHREQLRELAARLASLSDSIAADEASKTKWADKQDEAERELAYVRDAIRQTSARRASLLDVCATLDVPYAAPPQQQQRQQMQLQMQQQQQRLNRGAAADPALAEGASFPADAEDCTAALALGPSSAAAADMEWRATRLECLMYRVLWVSEAVKMFQPQYSPRQSTHHYDLFIRATHWAKQLSEEYEDNIRSYCCELERLRARLRDVAAVDLGYEIGAAALEVVRRRIEAAARAAREAASLTLLKELEEEEERRKAAQAAAKEAKEGAGGGSGGSSKKAANKKAAKASQDSRSRAQKEKERELAKQAEDEARRRAEEEDKERVAAARRAREAALEAELERRRRELEELEAQREAEAIRAAQEASLREQHLREQREKEQRERAVAAAAAAAAAQAQALAQAAQQQQQQQQQASHAAGPGRAGHTAATGQLAAGSRKQEPAAQQQVRRQTAVSADASPDKQQPKRNAASGTRSRGAHSVPDRSPGSPEPVGDVRAAAAVMPVANGSAPASMSRGGTPAKPSSQSAAAGRAAANPQAGTQVASTAAPTVAKAKQGPNAAPPPPANGASSGSVSDSAAAAAVAAATAGIVKAHGGPGARSSPAKQSQQGQGAAGGNAPRRQQQQQQQPLSAVATASGMPPAAAGPIPGNHHTGAYVCAPGMPPVWVAIPPAAPGAPLSLPQQPMQQLPVMSMDASHGASSVGMAGPVSPGSEFPPLSVANAAAGPHVHHHRHPPPPLPHALPPMQPSPQQQALGFQLQQQHAHAHAFAEAQARLLALAQVPAAAASAVAAAAAAAQQQQSALSPRAEMSVLPSEHLHAHFRQQQLQMQQLQQNEQRQHYRQQEHQRQLEQRQQQQQQQLFQPSPRPHATGMGVSVFDPFAENPLLKALAAMEAKTPQPSSPNGATGAAPPLVATSGVAAAAGRSGVMAASPTHQQDGQQAQGQLPLAHSHADPLLASMQTSQSGGAAAPNLEADTHVMSIMSILDQDSQSPASGSGPSGGPSQQAGAGAGARSSPTAASGSSPVSQATTANSSPQRVLLPPGPPSGPPGSMYGNPFSMASAAGPPLLPGGADGSPSAAAAQAGHANAMGSPAAARSQSAGLLPNGGAGMPQTALNLQGHLQGDALAGGVAGGLSASSAFGSGIWRQGGEQLGGGSQLPMGMLGLGLGLSGIGTGPNTWGSVGLPQPGSAGGGSGAGALRSSSTAAASPRQVSGGGAGEWSAAANGTAASAGRRDSDVMLPESVDSLVASLPTTLLPSSLDAEPSSPSPPAGGASAASSSGLAPTAAPFYPASLRGKVAPSGGGSGGGGGGGMVQQQQQHMGAAGISGMGMGMNPMGMGAMFNDGTAAWMGGLVPGKQGPAAGGMAGAAANAAAAMAAAAANGLVGPGAHTAQQQLGGPGGMSNAMGPGAMRYGVGLYNGDGVNWSHGGLLQSPGGVVGAPGVPAAVRATSTTWAPFVPPAVGHTGMGASQQQIVQQAAQQQAAQQPQQMAGWQRGQRWRN